MYSQIKEMLILIFGLSFSLFLSSTVYSQNSNDLEASTSTHPQVEIAGSEVSEFNSAITGEKYFIYVGLPRSYSDTDGTYPTLFIMDADGSFGTCTEISRLLFLVNK